MQEFFAIQNQNALCLVKQYATVMQTLKSFSGDVLAKGFAALPDNQKDFFRTQMDKSLRCFGVMNHSSAARHSKRFRR